MAINLTNHKATDTYYGALATYRSQDVTHEQATRLAFSTLFNMLSKTVGWTLVMEQTLRNRRENISDWALKQFQAQYGPQVTKRDIFHYIYAVLHSPQYRERYAENLKRELPPIPFVPKEAFQSFVETGACLADPHLNYEQAREYPLQWLENKDVPFSWRVTRMQLSKDKAQIKVNESLTLAGIPAERFEYRLGNRSALEWVIDQCQISADKRSGIASDPNRPTTRSISCGWSAGW
jgi:predicted helicase